MKERIQYADDDRFMPENEKVTGELRARAQRRWQVDAGTQRAAKWAGILRSQWRIPELQSRHRDEDRNTEKHRRSDKESGVSRCLNSTHNKPQLALISPQWRAKTRPLTHTHHTDQHEWDRESSNRDRDPAEEVVSVHFQMNSGMVEWINQWMDDLKHTCGGSTLFYSTCTSLVHTWYISCTYRQMSGNTKYLPEVYVHGNK